VSEAARAEFARVARSPEGELDLAEAALWIAAEEYPGLDVASYLARLRDFGAAARASAVASGGTRERIERLNDFMYRELGFAGNRSEYYDPRNSFLNEVIERRTGIPITLAIVWLSLAREVSLPARGVGFPGHFLVRSGELFVDPFEGNVLEQTDCEARFRAAADEAASFDPSLLEPTPGRDILARVLRNLKQVWLAQEDWTRALACAERILLLAPEATLELRDRGLLYGRLECFAAAQADLRRFLELAPEDPTAEAVRGYLLELSRGAPRLH
jgi:regulator of sirC expression with transglutaminase-like and TPR domain